MTEGTHENTPGFISDQVIVRDPVYVSGSTLKAVDMQQVTLLPRLGGSKSRTAFPATPRLWYEKLLLLPMMDVLPHSRQQLWDRGLQSRWILPMRCNLFLA